MTTFTNKLSKELKTEFKNADEIWIAVALLNNTGLEFILQSIPNTCKLNFIVGIDLPTDPKALSKLLSLKGKRTLTAKILTEDFFHPKVYIIKSSRQITAFVGSANCTNGGLTDNIEMSIGTKDINICKGLIDWFEKTLSPVSQPLTLDFIKGYQPKYDKRVSRRKKEKEEIENLKEREQVKLQANIKRQKEIISEFKRFRNLNDYLEKKQEGKRFIRNLRKCLDYPNFVKLDLKTFFSIKAYGNIDPRMTKKIIEDNQHKFSRLMKYICNDKIPLDERINNALDGEVALPYLKRAFISKILVVHNPKEYYVHNDAFIERLKQPFGLELPKRISFGKEYELTRDILKELISKTNIDDFATLDRFIWILDR